MKKRMLSILLAIILVFSLSNIAIANDNAETVDPAAWQNKDELVEDTDFEIGVEDDDIMIPSETPDEETAMIEETQAIAFAAPAPEIIVDYEREWFHMLSAAMEYRIDGGAWVRVNMITMPLQGTPYLYGKTVEVRFAETPTEPASQIATYEILPVGSGTIPPDVVYEPLTDMITGLDSTMEYKEKSQILWTSCNGDMDASGLRLYTSVKNLEFRYRGIGSTVPPSLATEIELPVKPVPQLDPIAIDFVNEKLINLDPRIPYQFQIGATAFAQGANNTEYPITRHISTGNVVMRVFDRTTFTELPRITLPGRPAAPNISFTYNQDLDKYIASSWNNIEFSMPSSQWVNLYDSNGVIDVPDNTTTYSLRTKGNSTTFASASQAVTLNGRAAAPTLTLSYVTELITGVTSAMEYRVGSGNWQDVAGTSISLADNPSMYGQTISIRMKATDTTPESHAREIVLPEQGTVPIVNFDQIAITVNTTAAMQYRVQGTTAWITCTANMPVSSLISPTADVVLEIRTRGINDTIPPSKTALLTLHKRPNVTMNSTGRLTDDEKEMYHRFTLSSRQMIFAELKTNNVNYRMELVKFDPSTNVEIPFSPAKIVLPNQTQLDKIMIGAFDAGDYAWKVSSVGTVGDSYTILMNATLTGAFENTIAWHRLSSDYKKIIHLGHDNHIYTNGKRHNINYSNYSFSRSRTWPTYPTGYMHWEISVKVNEVQNESYHSIGRFSYYETGSNFVRRDFENCLFIEVGIGTRIDMFFQDTTVNPPIRMNFTDGFGRLTPRPLDSSDFINRRPNYLVYNLDTDSLVTFYSESNTEWGFIWRMPEMHPYHTW